MKILMIGAHQDDNEICCGGLAHKYISMGYEVYFLSLCNGNGGHHILSPEETTKVRAKESAKVKDFLNLTTYDVWDIDDCSLCANLATRRRLIRYIRKISPDLVITHRPNDYHADHRAAGQLVCDASYLLVVPHECPDTPAMRRMPVIMYFEDPFTDPVFRPDCVLDMDDENEIKLQMLHLNVSQVYEWLPYVDEEDVPEDEKERFEWLRGMDITEKTTDEEIMAAKRGYSVLFAKTAARFRKQLIDRYGEKKGSKIRYAEAYQLCEYGRPLNEELKKALFPF